MTWHSEALDDGGHEAIGRLTTLGADFYLAGGTALALRLGHRMSLDLDLFSLNNRLGAAERRDITATLKASGPFDVLENRQGTMHLQLGATATSLLHYPYPLLAPPDEFEGLLVAGEDDIAAMKLSAVTGRGARKDFIDLYALGQRHGLKHLIDCARRRFPDHPEFFLQVSRALVYFEDAEKEPMPRMLAAVKWPEVRDWFTLEVPRAIERALR